ncbi:HIT family protein [Candidatus Woesearchaeota archaeon]|nr:HIT family protein [Candidatus Woesearchaeota archaeon]
MDNCIFCKIGKGEIPAHKVYEDSKVLAFLDVKPHAKGHTVVIPKTHGVTVFDFKDSQLQELMAAIRKTMDKIQKVLQPDGFNVGWNHNSAAGQVVPHLHVHIMPRYLGDGGGSMHSIVKNPGDMAAEEVGRMFK